MTSSHEDSHVIRRAAYDDGEINQLNYSRPHARVTPVMKKATKCISRGVQIKRMSLISILEAHSPSASLATNSDARLRDNLMDAGSYSEDSILDPGLHHYYNIKEVGSNTTGTSINPEFSGVRRRNIFSIIAKPFIKFIETMGEKRKKWKSCESNPKQF
jgi:hypothetical protein